VVCFLVINEIRGLPKIAVQSVLEKTSSDIVIGYLHDSDLNQIPKDPRIKPICLSEYVESLKIPQSATREPSEYIEFGQEMFFEIVRLKWVLFQLLSKQYEIVIYSDLDVLWLRDACSAVQEAFSSDAQLDILVQDLGSKPGKTSLCMGFFAFRSSEFSESALRKCAELHRIGLLKRNSFGDDDAISEFAELNSMKAKVGRLPQSSFPAGNLFNLLIPISILPGLRFKSPFIFHANFIVGVSKKLLVLRAVLFFESPSLRRLFELLFAYLWVVTEVLPRKLRART